MSNYFNLLKCRVCLGDFYCSNVSSLFVHNETAIDLSNAELLMECTSVKLTKDDGYPQNICNDCLNKLTNSYEFKKICEYSDKVLKSSVSTFDESGNIERPEQNIDPYIIQPKVENYESNDGSTVDFSNKNFTSQTITINRNDTESCKDDGDFSGDGGGDIDSDDEVLSEKIKKTEKNETIYKCSECNKTYVSSKYLKMHQLTHTSKSVGKTKQSKNDKSDVVDKLKLTDDEKIPEIYYPCCYCHKNFIDSIYLINHVKRIHGNIKEQAIQSKSSSDWPTEKKYPCCFCDQIFVDTVFLINHVQKEHKDLGRDEIVELIAVNEKKLKCHICDVTFDSTQAMRDHHEKTHLKDGVYPCSECDKKYMNIKYLEEHSLLHSDKMTLKRLIKKKPRKKKVPIFECDDCGISYTDKRSLLAHATIHNPVPKKLHLCPYCGGNFQNPSSLKEHIRIHTGEKRFQCPICNRKFTHYSSLRTHRFIHTGEKNYSCEICGKAFYASSRLTQHKKAHSDEKNFPCGMCDKRFKYKNLLKRHVVVHTTTRRFKCDVCSKEFNFKKNLLTHTRIHGTGTKKEPEESVPPTIGIQQIPAPIATHAGHPGPPAAINSPPILEELKPIIDDSKSNMRHFFNQGFVQPQYLSVYYANH